MDAAFTAEQDEIRRTLRHLLAEHGGPDGLRSGARTAAGYDEALWRTLARDLGLPGLAFPTELSGAGRGLPAEDSGAGRGLPAEDSGAGRGLPAELSGAGRGLAELAVACEETGRALLPSPLIATVALAAPLIAALGTEAQRAALLPRIATGGLTAALAVPGTSLATALGLTGDLTGGTWAGGGRAGGMQARPVGGAAGWRLYGEAAQVLDGHRAGLLLVAAHAGGFPRSRTLLFLVHPDAAAGVVRTRRTSLDETRPLARIQLRDTGAELLGADDTLDVTGALAAAGQRAAALLAAEAVGAAASALERAAAHVMARERPGPATGPIQGVKHHLADLYVRVQAARSAAYCAARDPATGGLALAQCLEALRITAAETAPLPGGPGVTGEQEAHPYVGRAAADELLFGPVHRLRDHAARQAGLFASPAGQRSVPPAGQPSASRARVAPASAEEVAV
ncbi:MULTISPECIES: acyl-CoA dehydrogenase family protein [unclassified Streptomyces]|uniref:acyl-CoA dehydrogenase family protein n=1 Tax=unclassified Streptomyces TaxID=2593676 RepID=UPI0036EC5FFA